jgi:hypothetical protein
MPINSICFLIDNIILLKATNGERFSGRINCKPTAKEGCKGSKNDDYLINLGINQ